MTSPTSTARILLVDDDAALRQSLAEQLTMDGGFQPVEAGDIAGGREAVKTGRFDAIILDVGLPDGDGRAFCRELRDAGVRCPILMLTGHTADTDTIEGLESGANDYITKPFRLGVLMARLRAQLRTHEQTDDAVFRIGPYQFQPGAKLLFDTEKNNKRIRLTDKETAILKFLFRAGNKPVARETLLGEVWGYNAGVATHTLETHVYRLRQKIERDPANVRLLVTDAGGYRLNAEG